MTAPSRPNITPELAAFHAGVRGGAIALELEGRTRTYAELHDRSRRAAAMMQDLGVRPADRVVWIGRTSLAWFDVFLGAALARACLTPINIRLAPPEIGFILDDSGADLAFVTPQYFDMVSELARTIARPLTLVAVDGEREGFASFATLMDAEPRPLPPIRAEDDLIQLYTSGTTGRPKGVRLTTANYAFFIDAAPNVKGFGFVAGETVLGVMPLFHVAGVNFAVATLAAGARLLLLPEFNPAAVLRLIEAERVDHAFLVPAMIQMVLQAPEIDRAGLSSLKSVSYGASPISDAVLSKAKAAFGCGFVQFYGMTETTGAGSHLPAEDHTPDKLRSCGKSWPGLEMRIQDDAGAALPPGEIGQIAIRGPAIMAGYWRREEATRDTIAADGWLATGDAGFQDENGYFFVHDRVKDMIISGGENIYPAEVENAIHGCPGVADAAVIGVPDEMWGEAVKAMVVAAPGCAPTEAEIIAWGRRRIAGFKAPKSVTFVEALPRNASGKILRRELRLPYWEGHGRAVG
jgi:acyl-CoA synthetase (AMP-forming)/AMP-acid ligase II